MKITTKGRYGTRFMLELALEYSKKQPILLREIAEKQGISLKYLEQIVILLKNAGLIRSVRGAKGGYMLSKSPDKIKLFDVLTALEGDINVVDCISYPEVCDRVKYCITKDIWETISNKIKEVLSSITLYDLCKRKKEKK